MCLNTSLLNCSQRDFLYSASLKHYDIYTFTAALTAHWSAHALTAYTTCCSQFHPTGHLICSSFLFCAAGSRPWSIDRLNGDQHISPTHSGNQGRSVTLEFLPLLAHKFCNPTLALTIKAVFFWWSHTLDEDTYISPKKACFLFVFESFVFCATMHTKVFWYITSLSTHPKPMTHTWRVKNKQWTPQVHDNHLQD